MSSSDDKPEATKRWRVKGHGDDLITYWKSKPRHSNEYAAAEIIEELERELAEARFRPMGDNHHNALACPYCNPEGLAFARSAEGASKSAVGSRADGAGTVTGNELAERLELLAQLYAPDADTPRAMLEAAALLRSAIGDTTALRLARADAMQMGPNTRWSVSSVFIKAVDDILARAERTTPGAGA